MCFAIDIKIKKIKNKQVTNKQCVVGFFFFLCVCNLEKIPYFNGAILSSIITIIITEF